MQVRNSLGSPDRGPFDKELNGKDSLVHGNRHASKRLLMVFGIGLAAVGTPKAPQAISVLTEALAVGIAGSASHCSFCFCVPHHGCIIQQALAVVNTRMR
jgi:hypothetical protein